MKTSTSHNKYLVPRLKEDNDPISAYSTAHILFLKLTYAFLLLNFLISGCVILAIALHLHLIMFSCQRSLYTAPANPILYPSYLGFITTS